MTTGDPLPPPRVDAGVPAGWYPDPTGMPVWRWWNGRAWTAFTSGPVATAGGVRARKPRLPRWLSVPVVICFPLVLLILGVFALISPVVVAAGLVPLVIVLPVLAWLDRVEPEPRSSRWHAVLWGASVAALVSAVANTVVAIAAGEVVAMVVSAPLVEEAMKGLGIVWAVRRGEVDGLSDGVVYAGWVALGFAVVEDVSYFAIASDEGIFLTVFVVRALLTPFAHPLFTVWIGLAIGRAVRAGRPLFPAALWGYALAVATHAAWNGALAFGEVRPDVSEDAALGVVLVAMALFVVLFVAVAIALRIMRRREQRRFEAMAPTLGVRYGLPADEAAVFADWSRMRAARRSLPRRDRPSFDAVHAALARLWLRHDRFTEIDPAEERVLVQQLDTARAELERRRRGAVWR